MAAARLAKPHHFLGVNGGDHDDRGNAGLKQGETLQETK
jgi:hypothetical protein